MLNTLSLLAFSIVSMQELPIMTQKLPILDFRPFYDPIIPKQVNEFGFLMFL